MAREGGDEDGDKAVVVMTGRSGNGGLFCREQVLRDCREPSGTRGGVPFGVYERGLEDRIESALAIALGERRGDFSISREVEVGTKGGRREDALEREPCRGGCNVSGATSPKDAEGACWID